MQGKRKRIDEEGDDDMTDREDNHNKENGDTDSVQVAKKVRYHSPSHNSTRAKSSMTIVDVLLLNPDRSLKNLLAVEAAISAFYHPLDAVVSDEQPSSEPPKRPRRRWTPEQDAELLTGRAAGQSFRDLGKAIGVPAVAARAHFRRLCEKQKEVLPTPDSPDSAVVEEDASTVAPPSLSSSSSSASSSSNASTKSSSARSSSDTESNDEEDSNATDSDVSGSD